jgi:hypothetical protein
MRFKKSYLINTLPTQEEIEKGLEKNNIIHNLLIENLEKTISVSFKDDIDTKLVNFEKDISITIDKIKIEEYVEIDKVKYKNELNKRAIIHFDLNKYPNGKKIMEKKINLED